MTPLDTYVTTRRASRRSCPDQVFSPFISTTPHSTTKYSYTLLSIDFWYTKFLQHYSFRRVPMLLHEKNRIYSSDATPTCFHLSPSSAGGVSVGMTCSVIWTFCWLVAMEVSERLCFWSGNLRAERDRWAGSVNFTFEIGMGCRFVGNERYIQGLEFNWNIYQ